MLCSWESLLFLQAMSLLNHVGCLDIDDGVAILKIDEEQNRQTWPLENTDPGITSTPTYSLAPSTDGDTDTYTKFAIANVNASSYELMLNYTFDFENPDDVKTRKFVIKSSANGITSELLVQVQIQDINDHTPSFMNLPTTIKVCGRVCDGEKLFIIHGQDNDGSETANKFNVISFSITDGNIGNKFSIEFSTQHSALLKLTSPFNLKEVPKTFNLTIYATDKRATVNPNGRWVVSYLVINVTDIYVAPVVASFTSWSEGAVIGTSVNITCAAVARPSPSYTIIHNNTLVVSTNKMYTINAVEYSHAGSYKCIVKNKLGIDSMNYNFTVFDKIGTKGKERSNMLNGTECESEWYIYLVLLVLGIIIGILLSYIFVYFRTRFISRKPHTDTQEPQTSNVNSTYEDLDLTRMNAEENYQSLEVNSATNDADYENESSYTDLAQVREVEDNYQALT